MEILKSVENAFITIIRLGVVLRVIFCLIKMMTNEDDIKQYQKRIFNTTIFYILAETINIIKDLIIKYYAG